MRKFVLLFAAVGIISCTTTRYNMLQRPCLPLVSMNSSILIPWLPSSYYEQYLQDFEKEFKADGARAAYLPSVEWELKAKGIANPLDSSSVEKLAEMGYTHLLLIYDLEHREQGGIMNYYTPLEVSWSQNIQGYKPTWNERGSQSKLLFRLVELKSIKSSFSFEVTSVISAMIFRDKEGGETYVNVTDAESARRKAYQKGLQHLRQECGKESQLLSSAAH